MGLRPKRPGGKRASAEERATGEPVASTVRAHAGAEDARNASDAPEEREERRSSGRDTPLPPVDEVSPRHVAYVRGLLSKFGVSPSYEYEDLVQEVLLHASRSADSHLEPRALLFGITRHTVLRWMAKRDNERIAVQAHFEDAEIERAAPTVEELWRSAERANAVREAISELPDIFREVFVRCEIDEMPMPEVARELGIPVNTGYTRLHLGRARFQEAIKRYLARRRLGKDDLAVPIALGLAGASDDAAMKVARPAKGAAAVGRLSPFARWQVLSSQAILVVGAVAALWTAPLLPPAAAPAEPTALPEPPRAQPERTPAPVKSGSEKTPPVRATASLEDDIVSSKLPSEDGAGPNGSPRTSRATAPYRTRSEGTWARQIVGLARKGKRAEAATQAAAFLRLYPRSTYVPQIEVALAEAEK
ncbi:MAG: RNA polymerase sigma factor [Polyangiaceae bacterium]